MAKLEFDGSQIRHARELLGKRREHIALEIGRSTSYAAAIELNYRRPPVEVLASICDAVDLTMEDCFLEVTL